MTNYELFWVSLGLLGQGLFSARFLLQWWVSEKNKCSVIPIGFWYYSICGSVVLLIYALYKQDPVFIIGQLPGCFIYARNLVLIHRNKNQQIVLEDVIEKT